MAHSFSFRQAVLVGVVLLVGAVPAKATQDITNLPAYIRENYTRNDYQIAMRDGVQLYTVVYAPKDKTQKHPILMTRTPYGVAPYAKDSYRSSLGPNRHFVPEGYIFVYQDVRGCYMSEGTFVNMRPHLDKRKGKNDIDESTDTYDTIDWLIKNIDGHNGKVGLWGISYPGFYASAGMIDAHPALKAVSPQAPIADWFFDDFFHHGAFFLPHAFNFFSRFGQPRPKPTTTRPFRFDYPINDGYQFFLELGPLSNANKKYFKNDISFWNEMMDHPNYDAFWQARNLLPHLKNCAPAVMTVGGWFDAEDLYGALKTYAAVEKNNPKSFNVIVMGPWAHGGWSGGLGNRLGNISFGSDTSALFQKEIELPFFNHFLLGKGEHNLPEAYMFETGINKWRKFDQWPPKGLEAKKVHFHAGGKLSFEPVTVSGMVFDEYISDPKKPVPYTEAFATGMTREYMTDDQRFASKRPDVVVYQTDALSENITFAGPIVADLRVSTSGTDSDWIVKVIDVYPQGVFDGSSAKPLAGYQMMVRSEVIRGRFRNSYEKPEPFKAGEPTTVRLVLQDVLHTFPKGHRIMVQVCSTWFPLADRNPQKYVDNIFYAEEKDFILATQRVYCSQTYPTALEVGILKASQN
jgi:putative CocE/NonD family hydrolase